MSRDFSEEAKIDADKIFADDFSAEEIIGLLKSARQSAYALGVEDAAQVAHTHGDFCKYEADHGGSNDLYERAKGAHHIAQSIRKLTVTP